jgi:hypothetical protein
MADRSNPLPLAPGKLTRRKLYDLVWSTPRRLLAPAFACSDTWLKGMCRESCVPTPHPRVLGEGRSGEETKAARTSSRISSRRSRNRGERATPAGSSASERAATRAAQT